MRSVSYRGLLAAACLLLVALLRGSSARADVCHPTSGVSPCIDADQLWPHPGGGPYFFLGDPTTVPAGRVALGLVGTFLDRPIGVHVASANPSGSDIYLVDQAFDATLLFAAGITNRLELTLAAPVTVYQDGAGVAAVDGNAAPPEHTLARDLRFGLAFALLTRPAGGSGPALTPRLEFTAPTGTPGNFAGASTMVLAPSLAFSYRLGRVDLSAEVSARVRGEVPFAGAVMGSQIGAALGGSVDVLQDRWLSAGVEAFTLPTTSSQPALPEGGSARLPVPAEWIAHVSSAHFLGGRLVLSLGGGGAIPSSPNAAITSPHYRLDFAVRLTPLGEHTPR